MVMYKTIADLNGGTHVLMTDEEEAAILAAQASYAAAQPRLNLLEQIAKLEQQQTPRRMREALTDPTWINDLNTQIAALRAQL